MAKKKTDKTQEIDLTLMQKISSLFDNETIHFILGLTMVIFSVYLLLAFTSFFFTGAADQSILDNPEPGQLSSINNQIKNYAGSRGAQMASYLINDCFGVASYFILLFLSIAGMKLMRVRNFRLWKWFIGCSLFLIWTSVFLGFIFKDYYQDSFIYWGGMHGYNISNWLISQIGVPGISLLLLITALCFLIYLSARTIIYIRHLFQLKFIPKRDKKVEPITKDEVQPFSNPEPKMVNFDMNDSFEQTNIINDSMPVSAPFVEPAPIDDWVKSSINEDEIIEDLPTEENEEDQENNEPEFKIEAPRFNDDEVYDASNLGQYNPTLDLENYRHPTLELMKKYDNSEPAINMQEQNANKDKIISTLRSFGIEISTIKATVGSTVTLYEITPEAGVRISKIRGLEDDIALSLSALGIRIIAPIPGKGTIGIEVPNSNPKIVSMHSIIASKKFQESDYELPIAFGKTITNDIFMVDLCKMPHVLVAGATGQGKSVGLNAIITSLLYKKHPAELKFVLIDPKKVEFSIYSTIEKHFLAKLPDGEEAIITDFTKVVQTLNSLCIEMDTRYDLLKKAHTRNIKEYNEKFINRRLNPEKGHKFMPYIVVIIDEFGDLIMTAGKEVELPIARIAQLARAVGIHMIIATQRPTTNIITGTIKANFPARVAFRVSSMMDSRTILDRPGANQLIGRGDMLFLQGSDPVRVQCAFVDTPEVEQITNYISHQQGYTTAFYLPEYVNEESESTLGDVDMNRLDPMFEDAARLIVIHQQGSTSLIQRKFSIGYNRAGRIMDQLEKAGIVGPSEGSKARQVQCIDETDLEMRLNNLLR